MYLAVGFLASSSPAQHCPSVAVPSQLSSSHDAIDAAAVGAQQLAAGRDGRDQRDSAQGDARSHSCRSVHADHWLRERVWRVWSRDAT
jgi:hypothetical protein